MTWVGVRVRDIDMVADVAIFMNTEEGKDSGDWFVTWNRVGAGHTDIWMERWTCRHSSEVIHCHTQGNFVQCYVCHVCTYVRVCVSLLMNAAMHGPATCKQHVTCEATDVCIM